MNLVAVIFALKCGITKIDSNLVDMSFLATSERSSYGMLTYVCKSQPAGRF